MLGLTTYYTNSIWTAGSHIALLLLFLLLLPLHGEAQSLAGSGNITIDEGGKLWIKGSAGPVDFSCQARELSGKGNIENTANPTSTVTGDGQVHISISLPVESLDCGKRKMNQDMYGALKEDQHPVITYRLLDASLEDSVEASSSHDEWMRIRTRGVMEIAGVSDTTTVLVEGRIHKGNKFHVKGQKRIHMDTYDIEPPSTMFGLIRAKKTLNVLFDVTVTLSQSHEAQATKVKLGRKTFRP
ncbi:hypothetical protein [Fodinibius sediminis]|uniref:YceI-like domain-containing protein n=1 Tax=Fodinibius sediminis TaxID=1214077 RepID=A0A521BHV8_9BACT|nr:hypothetical protein [Fodinibius sediminis]SMO46727.1 hypothetical protein SAMN06265218_103128 [Fodinibius sediminis]